MVVSGSPGFTDPASYRSILWVLYLYKCKYNTKSCVQHVVYLVIAPAQNRERGDRKQF
jgi:hypothetical protein